MCVILIHNAILELSKGSSWCVYVVCISVHCGSFAGFIYNSVCGIADDQDNDDDCSAYCRARITHSSPNAIIPLNLQPPLVFFGWSLSHSVVGFAATSSLLLFFFFLVWVSLNLLDFFSIGFTSIMFPFTFI